MKAQILWTFSLHWFGCCAAGKNSAGNSGTFFTSIMKHKHGNGKVVCFWEQLIELSKAQILPGDTKSG